MKLIYRCSEKREIKLKKILRKTKINVFCKFVTVVAGGVFQAAETTGAFSLVGCTVAPGFAFEDFALLGEDPARKRKLLDKFPACQKFV